MSLRRPFLILWGERDRLVEKKKSCSREDKEKNLRANAAAESNLRMLQCKVRFKWHWASE